MSLRLFDDTARRVPMRMHQLVGQVLTRRTVITSAALATMFSAPVEICPALGPGMLALPVALFVVVERTGAVWTGGAGDVGLSFSFGNGAASFTGIGVVPIYKNPMGTMWFPMGIVGLEIGAAASTDVRNTPLHAAHSFDMAAGGPARMTVDLTYRAMNFASIVP